MRSTSSILSPTLNSKSPAACALKSYNATTYLAAGAAGFGFGAGGGGGARFVAARSTPLDAEYGGGALSGTAEPGLDPNEGGGGGAFFTNPDPDDGGIEREADDDMVLVVAERPRDAPPVVWR